MTHIYRYPPLGKIIYFIVYSFFGVNEFTTRLPQILFAVFTGILIFKISFLLTKNNFISWFSGLTFICLPITFHFQRITMLAVGTVFFNVIIIYYYIKLKLNFSKQSFFMFCLVIGLSFLYKRIVLITYLAIVFYEIIQIFIIKKKEYIKIKFYFFAGLITIPWYILGKIYCYRDYTFTIKNLTNPEVPLTIFQNYNSITGIIIVFLFIVGFLLAFKKYNNKNIIIGLYIIFFIFNIFVSLDNYYWVERFLFPNLPVFIILVFLIPHYITNIKIKKIIFISISVLFFINILFYFKHIFYKPNNNMNPIYNLKYVFETGYKYYPYNKLFKYLHDNLDNKKIYAPGITEPSHYYSYKYSNIIINTNYFRKVWEPNPVKQNINDLYDYCLTNNFDILVLPSMTALHIDNYFNIDLINSIINENYKNKFLEIKEFKFLKNKFIVFKIIK
jgi:hypothetical protein